VRTYAFNEKCVRLIRAHSDRCHEHAGRSIGNAAAHNEELDFMSPSELAKRAIEIEKSLDELIKENGGEN
jgi:aspartate ammonia-lyase